MRRLQSRLESARRRKEMAMEAFVSGKPASPVITSSSSWSRRISEQPDAGHVAEAIEEFEALEAKVNERLAEVEPSL